MGYASDTNSDPGMKDGHKIEPKQHYSNRTQDSGIKAPVFADRVKRHLPKWADQVAAVQSRCISCNGMTTTLGQMLFKPMFC